MTTPSAGSAIDAERRAALGVAKLAALVASRWGPGERDRGAVGATATLVEARPQASAPGGGAAAGGGRTGWVLPGTDADRALGPALVWADKHDLDALHLVVEASAGGAAAGTLARQAALFARPELWIWAVEVGEVVAVEAAPVPAPAAATAPPELIDLLIDAGVEIVVEGGMVRGEVNGLEVARIVSGRTTAGVPIDEPVLEVGVGKADRELTATVHGGLPAIDQLARVVEIVRRHRRPGAARHPLNQLVPERWLRAVLCRRPELVGLATLRPAEGPRSRANLTERDVALAAGVAGDDRPAVVACAVGIALDLVPAAADGRLALDAAAGRPPSRLVLATPERDNLRVVHRLASRLVDPAEIVTVTDHWRAAG